MIREIAAEEVQNILPLAHEFADRLQDVDISDEHWAGLWSKLITSGLGHVFADEDYTGALGMIIAKDVHSGKMQASEGFWFVSDKAGSFLGARLFRKFEKVAKEYKCERLKMVHMVDSMPEKLQNFYEGMGYRKSEVHYLKEVVYG